LGENHWAQNASAEDCASASTINPMGMEGQTGKVTDHLRQPHAAIRDAIRNY
jgi:hypothetical protein